MESRLRRHALSVLIPYESEQLGGQFLIAGSVPLIMPLETEIKIRISNREAIRRRLRKLGYRVHSRRVFESNLVFDSGDGKLRNKGELLRIRRAGQDALLTYKGPSRGGPHKSREEIETTVSDANALEQILERFDFRPVFRYEKYRTEYSRRGSRGIITFDTTPIGDFLELEGPPKWIDDTARALGHEPPEYITRSYGGLYVEYCKKRGIEPSNMVFGSSRRSRRSQPKR